MKINFSSRRLAESLMWRFLARAGMRFSLRSGLEVPVADRHEMATFKEIFVKQEYDDFLDRLPVPATVLDLGCNSGYFALAMLNRSRVLNPAGKLPKQVLVDANEAAVKRAQAVLGGCGMAADISYVTGLIGRRGETSATFFVSPASAESSAQNRTKHSRQVTVASVDVEALMGHQFPQGVDLVKCDIEGGEELLVREWAEPLRKAKALLIEWHGFEGTWDAFVAQLESLGFKLVMERPAGRYKNALFTQAQV